MSYDIIRNGLVALLNGQGFSESQSTTFKNMASHELNETFILKCTDGEADLPNEQQSNFLYDNQKWIIEIGFVKSSESDIEQRNILQRKKDLLLAELDDSNNWRSFCTLLRYRSWTAEENDNYFLLTIELKVKDLITY